MGVIHSKKNLPGTISTKMDIDIYTTSTGATFNFEEQLLPVQPSIWKNNSKQEKEHSDSTYVHYHRSNNISGSKVVHDLIMPSIVDG